MTSAHPEATPAERPSPFPTTHWTEILHAGNASQSALSAFCRGYWKPVYAHLRRRFPHHDAEDLTQKFFAAILEKRALARVAREGGRFRSFLLASLRHFLLNEWQLSQAQKRGGGRAPEPLQENDAADRAADLAFDRDWALAILQRTLQRLAEEYRREKNSRLFEALQPFLTGRVETARYSEIASQIGTTEANVKVLVHRLRKRCGALLREEVSATLAPGEDVNEEIRCLMSTLGPLL